MIPRPKIAAVVSAYHRYAHAQHICDRFLEGYGWNGRHRRPPMDLVSLYVDQQRENDLSREREARFPRLRIYPSIADALTLGTPDLQVDGVLLIAEHGEYPSNERGQKLWPRYEFFRQIVSVFRASGKTAPVFVDKHLSWNWDWAREMYDTARGMGFALMAGSSLPVTWRLPPVDLPAGAAVREAMCVANGGRDGGSIHALETIQGMVERRRGGERGVGWVQAYEGEEFWRAHAEGVWPRGLFEACLSRSHRLTQARAGFNHVCPTLDEMKAAAVEPWAFRYGHLDGTRCTMVMLNGVVGDFCFAADVEGRDTPLSTQMHLPMPPAETTLASFFSPQVRHIETLFGEGRSPIPAERTLLTTGLTAAGLESLHRGQARVETPHLHIAYDAPPQSTFWRG